MPKKQPQKSFFLVVVILTFLLGGIWFAVKGDTTPPKIILHEEMKFIGPNQELEFSVEDKKSGMEFAKVSIRQDDYKREISMFDFPREGVHRKELKLNIKPGSLGLKDGKATLIISAGDYSLFDNETTLEKEIVIDTHPPRIEMMRSFNHYISVGGSCLALYNVSEDALESGILVRDIFFKGYPLATDGMHVVYFALPWNASTLTPIMLVAKDDAGNAAKISFPCSIRMKTFRKVKMNISDRFLNQKMPEFINRCDNLGDDNLDAFLKVNRRLRQENKRSIDAICNKSLTERLWEGSFLRMKGSPEAQFADKRTYYHNGKMIDEQVHMGVDIAALKQFPVKAANNGMVVFADYIGIYGNTIIMDHGQGLFSMYSHLSGFKVKPGTEVKKGGVIGHTGTTGLAGGDHLHFSMIVHGIFVNPKEWWDPHWIKDNITAKLQPDKFN